MEIGHTTLALYALGAAALTTSLAKLKTRLGLSKAKQGSQPGSGGMGRGIAAGAPFYEYDGPRFFSSEEAPEEIAAHRRAGFMRLSSLYRERFAQTNRLTAEVKDGISD